MTDQETLSKKEYEFLNAIDKQNALIEKLKTALDNEKKTLEAFKTEKSCLSNDCLTLKAEIETLKKQLEEEITEAQHYIDEVEKINETFTEINEELKQNNLESEKTIAELKQNGLSEKDLLFFRACKADIVLKKLMEEGKKQIKVDELKTAKFPMELLGIDDAGVETSNYILKNIDTTIYKLTQK